MSKYNGSWAQRSVVVGEYKATRTALSDGDRGEVQVDQTGFLLNSLGTALNKAIDSIASYPGGTTPTQLTASGLVATGAGQLTGIFVSAASSTPTIKIWNNTAASGAVLIDTFTPVAGTPYTFFNGNFSTGCYVTIGGTVSATFFTGPSVNAL